MLLRLCIKYLSYNSSFGLKIYRGTDQNFCTFVSRNQSKKTQKSWRLTGKKPQNISSLQAV